MEGINLFVKILVFVKILSECTRKEGRIGRIITHILYTFCSVNDFENLFCAAPGFFSALHCGLVNLGNCRFNCNENTFSDDLPHLILNES